MIPHKTKSLGCLILGSEGLDSGSGRPALGSDRQTRFHSTEAQLRASVEMILTHARFS